LDKNIQEYTKELSELLEQHADEIRLRWIEEMRKSSLLAALSPEEIEDESRAIYDTCVQCLKTGSYEGAQKYAANMAKRGVLEAMTVDQIITGLLILRDVYGQFIFNWYYKDPRKWRNIVSVYEPVARRILNIVAIAFVTEREFVVKQQQETILRQEVILKLSTPLVEVWQGVVMVPLIGTLDSARAKQLTETVLNYIAREDIDVVGLDISGIAAVDTQAASYILRTIRAIRLMGSDAVITGIKPEVATTLVNLGVDLSGITTRSTLREGLEFAFDKLGLKVAKSAAT
jgi:rsbT co-antagonist protein RsbR